MSVYFTNNQYLKTARKTLKLLMPCMAINIMTRLRPCCLLL